MARRFRRRTRARLRIIHRKVYALTKGQMLASFFLSIIWSMGLAPAIEQIALPAIFHTFQQAGEIGLEHQRAHIPISATQLALEDSQQPNDAISRIEQRLHTLKIKSPNLSRLSETTAASV